MNAMIWIRGRRAGQFWVRALQLEDMVERARAEVVSSRTKPDEHCVMPVLIKYEQDEEFTWFCAFALFVDAVGVIDAHGVVLFSDRAHAAETHEEAKRAGAEILKGLQKHKIEIRETVPFTGGEK